MRGNRTATIVSVAFGALVLTAGLAMAGATPEQKCEASKNKAVGAYYLCREKAEATAITKGLPADYGKCTANFDVKWDGAETKGGGMCPDTVLTAPMNAFIAAQAAEAALVVAGAPIPTCQASAVGQVHETGQVICYDPASTESTCDGTGQDGELLTGIANSFTDNGDGTITDDLSGLMWEKLDDNNVGGIHDWDNTYDWWNAVAVKVAGLNSAVFAGHDDWRLPNVKELQTLLNFGVWNPATYPAFNTACAPGCTVETCSCTQPGTYWSSTTAHSAPGWAWYEHFITGDTYPGHKPGSLYVRAVRGGS